MVPCHGFDETVMIREAVVGNCRLHSSHTFIHDHNIGCSVPHSGRRFRVPNVVDDMTRECLAAVPDTSISGRRVVRELTDLIAQRGMIVSDNGTELTSNNLRRYALRASLRNLLLQPRPFATTRLGSNHSGGHVNAAPIQSVRT